MRGGMVPQGTRLKMLAYDAFDSAREQVKRRRIEQSDKYLDLIPTAVHQIREEPEVPTYRVWSSQPSVSQEEGLALLVKTLR